MNAMMTMPASTGEAASTCTAVVVGCQPGDVLTVRHGETLCDARRAISCLVEVEPDDTVLLVTQDHRAYVLAVLERPKGFGVKLGVAKGDLSLCANAGSIRLSGARGLDLTSSGAVRIAATELGLTVRAARFAVDELVHVGRAISAHVTSLKVVAAAFESVLERFLCRTKRSYRVVEETDHLRSRDIDHRADGVLHLRGRYAFVTAATLVKVNGSQVHLG